MPLPERNAEVNVDVEAGAGAGAEAEAEKEVAVEVGYGMRPSPFLWPAPRRLRAAPLGKERPPQPLPFFVLGS